MRLLAFFAAVLFLGTTSLAQTEATIKYDIKMSADDPEMEAQLAMFQNSTMTMYMKDEMFRQDVSMGGMMNTTTISNTEAKEVLILMDGMMGKYASKQKMDDAEDDGEEMDAEVELVDETKEIVGFTCKKAIVYDKEGNESVIWYTEEIEAPKDGSKYMKEGIPGMPLEFSVVQPQISMTFTATEFSDKVKKPKDLFSMEIPEGYEEKTAEELKNMTGGGQ